MSAIVFMTLGALLGSHRRRVVERVYILAVAAFMTLLVGLSRVGLGVHWATDVLAGWAFGFASLSARKRVDAVLTPAQREQLHREWTPR